MVFKRNIKKASKRGGRQPKKCDRCGKVFKPGDVYYTKYKPLWSKSGKTIRICQECYDRLFYDSEINKKERMHQLGAY